VRDKPSEIYRSHDLDGPRAALRRSKWYLRLNRIWSIGSWVWIPFVIIPLGWLGIPLVLLALMTVLLLIVPLSLRLAEEMVVFRGRSRK